MTTFGYIILSVPFVLAGASFIIAILQLLEKGFPVNTKYLFNSLIVREAMDKKPLFRQSGVVFLLVAGVFLMMGLDVIKGAGIYLLLELAFMIATVVYIVVSNKKMK